MRALRANLAALALLCLLLPYSAALALLASGGPATCGMQCCRRSGHCCCKRTADGAHAAGLAWTASTRCAGGCAQAPATRGSAASLTHIQASASLRLLASNLTAAVPARFLPNTGSARRGRSPPRI